MKFLVLALLFALSTFANAERDFVRLHQDRNSFLLAHETLISRLETNKMRFELAKSGSIKQRRILCQQITRNLKDLYEINVLNREWQTEEEQLKSENHLKILIKKRNEIILSPQCKGG